MTYILISLLLYAGNDLLWKKFLKDSHPLSFMVGRATLTPVFALILMYLQGLSRNDFINAWGSHYPLFIICSSLGAMGLYGLVNGLKTGTLQTFAFYISLTSVVSGIILIFYQPVVLNHLIGAICLIGGLIRYVGINVKESITPNRQNSYFVLMVLGFSGASFITWELLQTVQPTLIMFNQELAVLVIFGSAYLFKNRLTPMTYLKQSPKYLLAAMVISLAVYVGLLGLRDTDPFIASAMNSTTPLITSVGGLILFKEKFEKRTISALGLFVLGTLIIQLP